MSFLNFVIRKYFQHQNCMIGSKVTMVFTRFFIHDLFRTFLISNQSTVDCWGFSRGRSLAVGVSAMWHVTCDISHVTYDFFLIKEVPEKKKKKCKKKTKSAQKWRKVWKGGISYYLCYYPQMPRETVSAICGTFDILFLEHCTVFVFGYFGAK